MASKALDVGKIKAQAKAAYDAAPSPVTFLLLVHGAIETTTELQEEYNALPSDYVNKTYKAALAYYKGALEDMAMQAQVMWDLKKSKGLDWEASVMQAGKYARALNLFLNKAGSSKWAQFANKIATLKQRQATQAKEGFSTITWLSALWGGPWLMGIQAAAQIATEGAVEEAQEKVTQAKDAVEDRFADVENFIKQAGVALAGIATLAAGAWLVMKVVDD